MYTVEVQNNYRVAQKWGGGRRLILSTSSAFGGKNKLLGGLLVTVGSIAALELLVIFLCFRKPAKDNYFPQLDDAVPGTVKVDSEVNKAPLGEDIQQDQEALRSQ